MAIKRYFATIDNTITNSFKTDNATRGTGSNMGASDILEVFSLYGHQNSASSEISRALIQFDISEIQSHRSSSLLPTSGNVDFYLRLFNAKHSQTLPKSYNLVIAAIENSWSEGTGLDMEGYTDIDQSNWINATSTNSAATLADAIDITGHANGDKFTMTVPTSAGGDGVTYTFLLDSTTNVNNDTGANTFGISRQIPSDDEATRDAIIAAINGVANAAVKYGNADTGASSTLTAGTIGLTAAAGTSAAKITLTMDAKGAKGNVSDVLAAVTGFENALLLESSFTGGDGPWTNQGGDYRHGSGFSFTASFDAGDEDIEVNISSLVERWANDSTKPAALQSIPNYGVGVFFAPTEEAADRSYYTKKFFARGTEFFYKQPCIEARWNSSEQDDRGNFYYSSSLAPAADNLNTLYLYNYIRGRLRDIPSLEMSGGVVYVSLYSGSSAGTGPESNGSGLLHLSKGGGVVSNLQFNATGGKISTGIYTASLAITASGTPLSKLYDVWHDADGLPGGLTATQFQTGSISPEAFYTSQINPSNRYVTSVTNLKTSYSQEETTRFRVFVRQKDWSPTIYSKATQEIKPTIIESASFQVHRVVDDNIIIPHGTGTTGAISRGAKNTLHTLMSYDMSGNYFDFDMGLLEDGYSYGLTTAYYNDSIGSWQEQPEVFKFRIESRQRK